MGKPQLIWDGNSLDNATSRRISDQFSVVRSADGTIAITVSFTIQADTTEALHTLYQSTLADFNGDNKTLKLTLDAAVADSWLEDLTPYSENALQTGCAVSIDASRRTTAFAIPMLLIAGTIRPSSLSGSTVPNSTLRTVTNYDAGRISQIQVTGSFSPSSGATAAANYASGRATILTDILLTNADGSRNASSGMTLISEAIEDGDSEGGDYTVMLASEWQAAPLSAIAGVRRISFGIKRPGAENWQGDAELAPGSRPIFNAVSAEVTFDKSVVTSRAALEAKIPAIKTAIENEIGGSPLWLKFEAMVNVSLSKVSIVGAAQTGTSVLEFQFSVSRQRTWRYAAWERGDADYAQAALGAASEMLTVAIHRKGPTALSRDEFREHAERLAILTPGYTYIGGVDHITDEPNLSGEYGVGYASQSYSITWDRRKLKGATFVSGAPGTFAYAQEE